MNAKQAALETKDLAVHLQDKLNNTMDSFERDKNKTKELIQRVKDYLLGQLRTEQRLYLKISLGKNVPD